MTVHRRNSIITLKLTFLDVQQNVLFEVTSYLKMKAVTETTSTRNFHEAHCGILVGVSGQLCTYDECKR